MASAKSEALERAAHDDGELAITLIRHTEVCHANGDIGDMRQWFDDANYLDVRLVQFVDANYDRWLKDLPERIARLKRNRAL